jgi:hypothetical protein
VSWEVEVYTAATRLGTRSITSPGILEALRRRACLESDAGETITASDVTAHNLQQVGLPVAHSANCFSMDAIASSSAGKWRLCRHCSKRRAQYCTAGGASPRSCATLQRTHALGHRPQPVQAIKKSGLRIPTHIILQPEDRRRGIGDRKWSYAPMKPQVADMRSY